MVKVTVFDVVKKEPTGHAVVLLDEAGRRALPIWIGPPEAMAIAMGLRQFTTPRPLTYSFTASLLAAAGAQIGEVRIETLRENTYFAVVQLRRGRTVREVDARPSDALALAVRTGSPVYVAEEVLESGGLDVPAEVGELAQRGRGVDNILGDLQPAAPVKGRTEEEVEKAHQELVAFLFGGGA